MRSITQQTLRNMWTEIGVVPKEVFRKLKLHMGSGIMCIDIDSSLVNVHSQNTQKADERAHVRIDSPLDVPWI